MGNTHCIGETSNDVNSLMKHWTHLADNTYYNKLTNQLITKNTIRVDNQSINYQLKLYSKRLQDHNINIVRLIYFQKYVIPSNCCEESLIDLYTETVNHNLPSNCVCQGIIRGFYHIFQHYAPCKVNQNMIWVTSTNNQTTNIQNHIKCNNHNVRVWLNEQPHNNKYIHASEQQMIANILQILLHSKYGCNATPNKLSRLNSITNFKTFFNEVLKLHSNLSNPIYQIQLPNHTLNYQSQNPRKLNINSAEKSIIIPRKSINLSTQNNQYHPNIHNHPKHISPANRPLSSHIQFNTYPSRTPMIPLEINRDNPFQTIYNNQKQLDRLTDQKINFTFNYQPKLTEKHHRYERLKEKSITQIYSIKPQQNDYIKPRKSVNFHQNNINFSSYSPFKTQKYNITKNKPQKNNQCINVTQKNQLPQNNCFTSNDKPTRNLQKDYMQKINITQQSSPQLKNLDQLVEKNSIIQLNEQQKNFKQLKENLQKNIFKRTHRLFTLSIQVQDQKKMLDLDQCNFQMPQQTHLIVQKYINCQSQVNINSEKQRLSYLQSNTNNNGEEQSTSYGYFQKYLQDLKNQQLNYRYSNDSQLIEQNNSSSKGRLLSSQFGRNTSNQSMLLVSQKQEKNIQEKVNIKRKKFAHLKAQALKLLS